MPLADEIMGRYRSRSGGGGNPGPVEEAEEGDADMEAGKREAGQALLTAIKRGDPMAVCEAVKTIADEY